MNPQTPVDAQFSPTLPVYVMAKPAGALCNLRCDYCYYLEKRHLYRERQKTMMPGDVLETYIRDYIALHAEGTQVEFVWHGGEPLLQPLSFFMNVLRLQKKYAGGRQIINALQTNGTLITPALAHFFHEHNFLIGLSIDGPQGLHDRYRRSRSGRGSWQQVMKGIGLLNRYGVEWNAMAVVNDATAADPLGFYHFFKEIGCRYIQFTPVVERLLPHADGRSLASPIEYGQAELAPFSVTPEAWGEFLCTLFDEWVLNDVGEYFVQIFDATLAGWMGVLPPVCSMARTCGHATALEHNGDLYVCDHYVFPEFRLGNIMERPLAELTRQQSLKDFGANKERLLTRQCRECEYLFACHGECPRNRFALSADGEPGHNYLCAGYRRFFKHAAPYMDFMKRKLMHGEAPADVMEWARKRG